MYLIAKLMNTKRLILLIVISLLTAGNIYLGAQLFICKMELSRANQSLYIKQINEKTLVFAKLFVEKVLAGESEVDFEDRLQLENSIREINDPKIFDQWQKFIKSENDQQAQQEVRALFTMLLNKIQQ
ncbi:MAG: hypothetical protein A2402_01975 [Candidatus Staskawiczbacteria bacterium RIFOXYC1_FULL_37_43]|uniref:Chemotaxis methyl-accepting receptor HlyB-like 4HB MCP domain-containing protein n=1 Tax=Candidatus Nomurabacteria bacterium RIFOXYA1_FULL_35_17 TaxID=1801798 RepID=A0A1F6YHN8_9BACT|nr:MAG: hypothetical protein A2192_01460 [Candidatus Nomurabacteria bacterium RIFOXYA1_FULL_35_17]OGZ63535.1 MAG: hypothetical protein A2813_00330 [Candidatus Staskawiczbacteria bacterium RIFCSPHIGHO2_01_FULL_37_17]OGZ71395.1 MAG: hypothetical protein A2891_02315 [Candidatus Staskawiczbacteria bacterium RIFCSPLOWO2_01_FULL_37_19]OGZ80787.1 MAG: hypothetical protein A2353_00925 [Candidatus Staskawiczbacteria bacterium RIFOXYB1_FULL_38_37]OGZ81594.1 MAG: hypothetical protein A2402_01975 [Candidat